MLCSRLSALPTEASAQAGLRADTHKQAGLVHPVLVFFLPFVPLLASLRCRLRLCVDHIFLMLETE